MLSCFDGNGGKKYRPWKTKRGILRTTKRNYEVTCCSQFTACVRVRGICEEGEDVNLEALMTDCIWLHRIRPNECINTWRMIYYWQKIRKRWEILAVKRDTGLALKSISAYAFPQSIKRSFHFYIQSQGKDIRPGDFEVLREPFFRVIKV